MTNKRIHFLTLLMGFSQIYAWATTYYLPATIIKLVANQLGQNNTVIVGGFSWALLVGGLCAPKIGYWIDVKGGRHPLVVGSVLMGAGLIVLSQTNGLIVWYVAWTLIGLGMALGLFNATFATIGRLFGQKSKIIIMRITLISGFATLFWPITTYLIHRYGWQVTSLIYAMPHLLFWAPLYYWTIPNTVPAHIEEPHSELQVVPDKIKRVFYLLAIYATLRSMVGTSISVDILTLFEGVGLTVGAASVMGSLIGPSQIAGRVLEMFLGKNFNLVYTSIFWTAVLPIAIFVLVLVGPAMSSFFSIAYGMSNGVLTITISVLPMVLFGSKGYAKLLGKLALPVLIAQSISPLLVAPLIVNWSSNSIFILGGVVSLIALFCLIILSFYAKASN